MFPIAQQCVERVVVVPDEAIQQAQEALWRALRVVAVTRQARVNMLACWSAAGILPEFDSADRVHQTSASIFFTRRMAFSSRL